MAVTATLLPVDDWQIYHAPLVDMAGPATASISVAGGAFVAADYDQASATVSALLAGPSASSPPASAIGLTGSVGDTITVTIRIDTASERITMQSTPVQLVDALPLGGA